MCRKDETYPVEVLTSTEIKNMFRHLSTLSYSGRRNRALLAVLYRCGLRCSEALALKVGDIDLDVGTVRVLHGKGNKARTVGLDSQTGWYLTKWLELRSRRAGLLFVTTRGDRLDDRYVRQFVARIAAAAGVEKRVHPHAFRHTHAAELARENVPINVIQRQLGHSNVSVTSRYLDHIAPTVLIETIRSREWE